ncbi:hypothetical protein GIS00_12070 [Nakamurella sp. YIM 132087]|uniref:DUF222 domain-containing protein n=1 Tax=Nakamurella alba TaxID=2665158 RepID=A0A7K1FMY2_9ACTN|nr:hypothetical protein [Nakamurella alba]MTD14679.1 hypothetical protein [Nakamurella alba]
MVPRTSADIATLTLMSERTTDPGQQALIRAVTPDRMIPPRELYRHPGRHARADEQRGTLRTADLAWLDRLHRDPAQVSDADAERVAVMQNLVRLYGAGTTPDATSRAEQSSNLQLLTAIWEPINTRHNRLEAEHPAAELKNTRVPDTGGLIAGAAHATVAHEHLDVDPRAHRTIAARLAGQGFDAADTARRDLHDTTQAWVEDARHNDPTCKR